MSEYTLQRKNLENKFNEKPRNNRHLNSRRVQGKLYIIYINRGQPK